MIHRLSCADFHSSHRPGDESPPLFLRDEEPPRPALLLSASRCALAGFEGNHFGARGATHGVVDLARNAIGSGAQRVVEEMGVALGGDRVQVAEDLAKDRQTEAAGGAGARPAVAEVVQPDSGQVRPLTNALPGVLEADAGGRRSRRPVQT